jgi:sulfide:quinone oxidoreductase
LVKRVLVIGGGNGGMTFAHTLKDRLGDKAEVSRNNEGSFYMAGPSKPLVVSKEKSYYRMVRGYDEAMAKGIKFNSEM